MPVVAPANANPFVTMHGGAGKKVQVTITKEVNALPNHVHAPHSDVAAHNHVMPPPHPPHVALAAPLPAQLHLKGDTPILIDNATVADLLHQLLIGNIQNVQSHGHPLVLPAKGKFRYSEERNVFGRTFHTTHCHLCIIPIYCVL